MLPAVFVLGAAAAVGVLAASPAGAVHRAAGSTHTSFKLSFPIPAATQSAVVRVSEITLKVKLREGAKLKHLAVHTTNAAALDSNVRAVYIVGSPGAATRRTATFEIFALITRFPAAGPTPHNGAAAAQDGTLQVTASYYDGLAGGVPFPVKDAGGNCQILGLLNTAFEDGTTKTGKNLGGISHLDSVTLIPALPSGAPTYQTSYPEEVLDDQVFDAWGACPGTPETYDSGPG